MANVLDCDIIMFTFRINTLRKGVNPPYQIVPLLFFYKDGFGIKLPTRSWYSNKQLN